MKQYLRYGLVSLGLTAAFSAIVFTVPFRFNAIFWVAYCVALLSFVGFGAAFYLTEKRGRDAKSWFYGFPLVRLGALLTAVQVVLSVVMMVLPFLPVWVGVLEGIVLLGFFTVSMLAIHQSRDEILRQEHQLHADTATLRALQSQINPLASQAPTGAKAALNKLADRLRYSDPVSSDMTRAAERELIALVNDLQVAVVDGDEAGAIDLCEKAQNVLNERNRLCKLGKR